MFRKSFIVLWLAFSFQMTLAQEPEAMKGMVERHNYWRNEFNLPQVKWSTDIAKNAQKWADYLQKEGCILKHSSDSYGENIFWASGGTITPISVTDSWAEERANFNFDTFQCKSGLVCGHYTQIIWETTSEIGCAMASCGTQQIWVCQYNPPGNWVGKKPFNK